MACILANLFLNFRNYEFNEGFKKEVDEELRCQDRLSYIDEEITLTCSPSFLLGSVFQRQQDILYCLKATKNCITFASSYKSMILKILQSLIFKISCVNWVFGCKVVV